MGSHYLSCLCYSVSRAGFVIVARIVDLSTNTANSGAKQHVALDDGRNESRLVNQENPRHHFVTVGRFGFAEYSVAGRNARSKFTTVSAPGCTTTSRVIS